jgi:diacylglycerol kinase (ATP)
MDRPNNYFSKRVRSFGYAIAGVWKFLSREDHAKIHLLAAIAVMMASLLLNASATEIIELVAMAGFVWTAEMFNTCIEKIMDFISLENHPDIQFIKDVAAGAVLVASLTAFITALIIFIPKL